MGAMSTSRHSILFLSGAGLPAGSWDDVRDRLGASYTAQVAPRPEGGAAGLRDYAEAPEWVAPASRGGWGLKTDHGGGSAWRA